MQALRHARMHARTHTRTQMQLLLVAYMLTSCYMPASALIVANNAAYYCLGAVAAEATAATTLSSSVTMEL